ADPQDEDRPGEGSPAELLSGVADNGHSIAIGGVVAHDDAPPEAVRAPAEAEILVKVLGPVVVTGLRSESNRRIVEELLIYLRCHDSHHRSAEQIQAGIWPLGTHAHFARKTFHNYPPA